MEPTRRQFSPLAFKRAFLSRFRRRPVRVASFNVSVGRNFGSSDGQVFRAGSHVQEASPAYIFRLPADTNVWSRGSRSNAIRRRYCHNRSAGTEKLSPRRQRNEATDLNWLASFFHSPSQSRPELLACSFRAQKRIQAIESQSFRQFSKHPITLRRVIEDA